MKYQRRRTHSEVPSRFPRDLFAGGGRSAAAPNTRPEDQHADELVDLVDRRAQRSSCRGSHDRNPDAADRAVDLSRAQHRSWKRTRSKLGLAYPRASERRGDEGRLRRNPVPLFRTRSQPSVLLVAFPDFFEDLFTRDERAQRRRSDVVAARRHAEDPRPSSRIECRRGMLRFALAVRLAMSTSPGTVRSSIITLDICSSFSRSALELHN